MPAPGKSITRWLVLLFSLLALTVIDLSYGSVSIPAGEVLRALTVTQSSDPMWRDIVLNYRLANALTYILAGAAMGDAGLQIQRLFSNPLAGPDVNGLTAGACLAVS